MGSKSTTAIRRVNLPEAVAEHLLALIRHRPYEPGSRLPSERELCEQLGVGRTSVREALGRLEALSVLAIRQGEGVFVREVSLDTLLGGTPEITPLVTLRARDVRDILQTRRLIEVETAGLAAQNRTAEDLARLDDLMRALQDHLDDTAPFLKIDLQFHVSVAEASGNGVLPRLVKLLRNLYLKHSQIIVTLPGITQASLDHHRQILAALREGDAAAARRSMDRHLQHAEQAVLAGLRAEGGHPA